MIETWMQNHLVSNNICNVVNLQCPKTFTRHDFGKLKTLGLQLVLVTQTGGSQSILSKTNELVTLDTICSVAHKNF